MAAMNDNTDGVEQRPSPISGKGLFTKRKFGSGAVLAYIQRPLVANLAFAIEHACSWCFLYVGNDCSWLHPHGGPAPKLIPCTGCEAVKYCNKSCQSKHWEANHKDECKVLAEHMPMPNPVRATMQILQGLEKEDPRFVTLMERESNYEKLRTEGGQNWEDIVRLAPDAYRFAGRLSRSDINTARKIMCLVLSTGINIQSAQYDFLGSAQDPLMSTLNHSCEPNATLLWYGPKLILRALKPISLDEEIFVTWVDSNSASENDVFDWRKECVRRRGFFTCDCGKCKLGREAPADKWLKPLAEMSEMAQKSADHKLSQLPSAAESALPLRPVGSSIHEKRAATLEACGYRHLLMAEMTMAHAAEVNKLPTIIGLLEMSGLFASSRAPLPGLYNRYWKACHLVPEKGQSLLAAMRIHFDIDPVVYPEPHHPKRVLHAWNLCGIAQALAMEAMVDYDRNETAVELGRLGVPTGTLFIGLLMELKKVVPRAYGVNSQMMVMINKKWSELTAENSIFQAKMQCLHLNREEWHDLLQENGPWIVSRGAGISRQMRMTLTGLVLPETSEYVAEDLEQAASAAEQELMEGIMHRYGDLLADDARAMGIDVSGLNLGGREGGAAT